MSYYPKLADNISIRNYSINEYVISLQNGKNEKITQEAFDIYSLCNGQITVDQMIINLSDKYDFELSDFNSFLLSAVNRKIISLEIDQSSKRPQREENSNQYYPLHITFLPTTGCNLNCDYCYGSFNAYTNEITPLPKVKQLFDLLSSINISTIELTGGEPLYHPDFHEILKLALKTFKYTAILSNGVLFNDRLIDLLKRNKGKFAVQISIDGFSSEMNDKVRGKANTWFRTITNIKKLVALEVPLRIGYVITADNYEEIEEAVELMRSLGVKDIAFSIAEGIGRGKELQYPDKKSLSYTDSPFFIPIKEKLEQVTRNNEDIVFSVKRIKDFETNNDQDRNCGAGHRSVTVLPSGDFIPCPMMNDNKFVLGNIYNKVQMEKYFNPLNVKFSFFKAFLKKPLEDDCISCEYENYCGSCLVRIIDANKKMSSNNGRLCKFISSHNIESDIAAFL